MDLFLEQWLFNTDHRAQHLEFLILLFRKCAYMVQNGEQIYSSRGRT